MPYAGDVATTASHQIPDRNWPWPNDRTTRPANGWWMRVTLDLATGEITAEPSTGHQKPHIDHHHGGEIYLPDVDAWQHGYDWDRWPQRLIWLHNAWPMTREQTVQMLDWVEPHAQGLLDTIERLPGGGYDWTPLATAHHWRIHTIVSNIIGAVAHDQRGVLKDYERNRAGMVTFEQVAEWYPHLADPLWTTLRDVELDKVAHRLAQQYRAGSGWVTWAMENDIAVRLGWGDDDVAKGLGRAHYPTYVVGARAGLRRYRDAAVAARTGLPAAPAERWLSDHAQILTEFTESTTDKELEQLVRKVEAVAAAQDQVALFGTSAVLRGRRAALREAFRQRLADLGDRTDAAFQEYLALRSARESAMISVIGWRDDRDYNDDGTLKAAELGRLARVSRQAVSQLADRLPVDAENEREAAAV